MLSPTHLHRAYHGSCHIYWGVMCLQLASALLSTLALLAVRCPTAMQLGSRPRLNCRTTRAKLTAHTLHSLHRNYIANRMQNREMEGGSCRIPLGTVPVQVLAEDRIRSQSDQASLSVRSLSSMCWVIL